MGIPVRTSPPMTIEDFLLFTDTRPDDEKWELIAGEPIMNASPVFKHQIVVGNFIVELHRLLTSRWAAIPGIGVRLSDTSAPVPDVLARPRDRLVGAICDDIVVAVEVLSPSTANRDLRWKRKAYASLPTLQHYVVAAPDEAEILVYDRASGFIERRVEGLDATLDLSALGVTIPLAAIYRHVDLDSGPEI